MAQRWEPIHVAENVVIVPLPHETPPAPPVSDASGPALALAELEAIAHANNPTLLQAAARMEAVRGEYVQAGLYPNPVVGYKANEIGNEGRAGQQGAFISQEIVTARKRQWHQAVLSQEIEQADFTWQAQRQRVLTDVRRGYYDVLIAQHAVAVTAHLVRVGQEGVQTAEALLRGNEVSRFDVLQARIEADAVLVQRQKAVNRQLAAWRTLAATLGMPQLSLAPVAGNLRDAAVALTWDETRGRLLAESPQLARAQIGVARGRVPPWAASALGGVPTSICKPVPSTTRPRGIPWRKSSSGCRCRCTIATRATFSGPKPN